MVISMREVAVLQACEAIGQKWHLSRMQLAAQSLGSKMTEIEFAQIFDDLVEKGCISGSGKLIYELTPAARRVLQAWRERKS